MKLQASKLQAPEKIQAPSSNGAGLTTRQRQVLAGIASGRPHKQIADEMGISYQTFCTHRKDVYKRLGIHSETEAVRVAASLGIE